MGTEVPGTFAPKTIGSSFLEDGAAPGSGAEVESVGLGSGAALGLGAALGSGAKVQSPATLLWGLTPATTAHQTLLWGLTPE